MKTKYFLPVVAIVFAACSDATAPLDLHVAAARQTTPPPTSGGETFDNGIASLGAWSPLQLATSPGSSKLASTSFLGRFADEVVRLEVPAGASSVTISFDLYIIGTWDGAGQQGFGRRPLADRSEPQRRGTREHFPYVVLQPGDQAAEFPEGHQRRHEPERQGRSRRRIRLDIPRASGKVRRRRRDLSPDLHRFESGSGALTFLFHRTTPSQDLNDESWGLDNVLVTRN